MANSLPPPLPMRTTKRLSMDRSLSLSSSMRPLFEELQCSVCLDVFTDPVSTPCGHNFCKSCLNSSWENSQVCSCPLCRERFSDRPDLKINTELRQLGQLFKERLTVRISEVLCDICDGRKMKALKSCLTCQTSYCETHLEPHRRVPNFKKHKLIEPVKNIKDYICQKHERPLELFCRDDQMCVCVFCTDGDHKTHNTVPLEEESKVKKTQLIETQKDMQKMIQDRNKKIRDIKHLAELRKDEKLIQELQQEINELKIRNSELDHLSHTKDHLQLLQLYPSICSPLNGRNWSDVSLETLRRALTQLQETPDQKVSQTVLRRIQQFAVDVTLDRDTAYPELILSDDGKEMIQGDVYQDLPDIPERFDHCPSVLGREGFSTGRFYFEVKVKGKTEWILGVVRESINRKGKIKLSPQDGHWCVALMKGDQYWACADPAVSLNVKPQKVGVFVDYEDGLVCFFDVVSRSHIFSFTRQSFINRVYPYFCACFTSNGKHSVPLIISPVKYSE
ncbi:bloodthirsty-related gene family, member 5 [Danio rerio]|uniref:Bloodthirsty-related gene family, member 5 n=1 Tax=Danio rerio TaxID=7955 RepID=A0AB13A8N5_DANRE|nr:bloodthirsty-related gene family, member 5 [Danio rerio]